MELLLARSELSEKPKKIKIEKVQEELAESGEKIYYFDRDNSHKDMMEFVETFEKQDFNVYFREIKYGLADNEYMYEVHIL